MGIPDALTAILTAQEFTTTEVGDNVNEWPSDAERNAFLAGDNTLVFRVGTTFGAMESGLRIQYRFDTQADLASGSQLVIASTEVIPVADMVAGARFYLKIPPRRLPSGYDFSGVFYVPVSQAANAGSVIAALVSGPEDMENNTV